MLPTEDPSLAKVPVLLAANLVLSPREAVSCRLFAPTFSWGLRSTCTLGKAAVRFLERRAPRADGKDSPDSWDAFPALFFNPVVIRPAHVFFLPPLAFQRPSLFTL